MGPTNNWERIHKEWDDFATLSYPGNNKGKPTCKNRLRTGFTVHASMKITESLLNT